MKISGAGGNIPLTGRDSELLRRMIFGDEKLLPRQMPKSSRLPAQLRKARQLANGADLLDRRNVFLRQGRLLAEYEDDFEYNGDPVRYYPTYESLTDDELRGYFAWRTKMRKGEFAPASRSFICLYAYELINNIGVDSPINGYEKLQKLRDTFGQDDSEIFWHIGRWLPDYVIYYGLDKELLAHIPESSRDQCISVIDEIATETDDRVIDAVKHLAPKWLGRSRFYAAHFEDMDRIIVRVLRRMAVHYGKNCKRSLVEQLFGAPCWMHYHMFSSAVFCDPLKRRDYEYRLSSQCAYICKNGYWALESRVPGPASARRLEKILKMIDSLMRDESGYGHPIKNEIRTRWILDAVREEIGSLAAEKAAAEKQKLAIDFSSLDKIRADAHHTQEKLIVDEDLAPDPVAAGAVPQPNGAGLSANEERLLRCLLYGGDLGWIKAGGLFVSVLADAINDKLYEIFEDAVLDDSPALVEDYAEKLKELIPQ